MSIGGGFGYSPSHPVQRLPQEGDAPFGLGVFGGVDKNGKPFENAVVPADTHAREVRKGLIEIFKNNPGNDFSVPVKWTTSEGHKPFRPLFIQPENKELLFKAAEIAIKTNTKINVWEDGKVVGAVDPVDLWNALPRS